ncbi:ArsR/SmtB family transcription factor [Cochlodiniinecator piscidefendens]|uniref:ArsR/SmtB family transcription factor n=1 Tax=Cochlodiniinecator piscidefendens TaxID=2715756 RepID=UPI00140BFFD5|nr:metalloregulator ArsR/SmtB family transcription factor [Cochlodiniinecator piscidefendens]
MTNLPTTFAALSDPTRFAMVERLMAEGALPAGALSAGVEISAPAISRHLKTLRAAGVIQQEVKGTHRIYSVRPEALQMITAWTMSHREFWESSMNRLEMALSEFQETKDD